MATVKFYESGNMLNFKWVYDADEVKDLRSSSISTLVDDDRYADGTGDIVVYRGSFSYNTLTDSSGATQTLGLKSGTMTGYEWYENQILRVQISGFSYDAVSALIYMEMANSKGGAAYHQELLQDIMAGNDTVTGSYFDDVLAGFDGSDIISGGRRHDTLYGGAGTDALNGNAGSDTLVGGDGADTLTGELGADTFRYDDRSESGDTITDFSGVAGNNDNFEFSAAGFGGGLAAGALSAAQFQSTNNPLANSASVRFIFDKNDFDLYYDADGSGAGAAVLVASLQNGAVVTVDDIAII
jgi:Ca2+-binding RTX toxin-like protein